MAEFLYSLGVGNGYLRVSQKKFFLFQSVKCLLQGDGITFWELKECFSNVLTLSYTSPKRQQR
jgi:hypothetical protein